MLAQIASVDTAKRTKDMLHKLVRDNRLMAGEAAGKREGATQGWDRGWWPESALREHVRALVNRVRVQHRRRLRWRHQGKKSLSSMEDAISTELARAKDRG